MALTPSRAPTQPIVGVHVEVLYGKEHSHASSLSIGSRPTWESFQAASYPLKMGSDLASLSEMWLEKVGLRQLTVYCS